MLWLIVSYSKKNNYVKETFGKVGDAFYGLRLVRSLFSWIQDIRFFVNTRKEVNDDMMTIIYVAIFVFCLAFSFLYLLITCYLFRLSDQMIQCTVFCLFVLIYGCIHQFLVNFAAFFHCLLFCLFSIEVLVVCL